MSLHLKMTLWRSGEITRLGNTFYENLKMLYDFENVFLNVFSKIRLN